MRLPEFFSELRSAVEYLHGEPGARVEGFSGFWRLFRPVEMMLTSICEDLGLDADKRVSMGMRAVAIRNAGVLPDNLARTLETMIRQRNMIAHAYKVDDISKGDLEPYLEYVLLLFKWYLTAYKEGLRLSETAAEAVLEDITCVRVGGERISRRIFLCYAKEDFARVTELYKKLEARGHKPWMDKIELLPGQNWELEIRRVIEKADFFIACMSTVSVTKRGYVQKEVKFALDVLGEIPVGQIYLIPVRFEPCEVPSTLRSLHWIDLDSEEAYQKLYQAIERRPIPDA